MFLSGGAVMAHERGYLYYPDLRDNSIEVHISLGNGPGVWQLGSKFFSEEDYAVLTFTAKPNHTLTLAVDTLVRPDHSFQWEMAGYVLEYKNPNVDPEIYHNRRFVGKYCFRTREGVIAVLKEDAYEDTRPVLKISSIS
jgi:hypothetical protein